MKLQELPADHYSTKRYIQGGPKKNTPLGKSQYLNNDLIFYYEIFRTYNRDSLTHNLPFELYKIISQNYDDFAKNDTFLKLTMMSFILIICSTFIFKN